jgi:serine/threonine-protein kinase
MGSVHYLPPEQASGKGCTIQSDIYSMGILMYELLSGTLPYKGDNAVEIALKHLKEPLPSIREELPNLPQPIENIILKACAKNPKNRYADAREMHEDLKTCLDPSRANEKKYVYKYPEFEDTDLKEQEKDIEKTMEFKKIDVKENTKEEDHVEVKKVTEKDFKKKENKTLVVLGFIFAALAVITASIVLILPKLLASKDVTIPNVTGKTVDEAVSILTKNGLKISAENKKTTSDTIAEGKVVKTDPAIGRSVKKGSTVTIYESSGIGAYVVEDFTGQNYLEVKAILEKVNKLFVVIEKEEVTDGAKYEENAVIKQDPVAGAKLKEGDTITLYIPDMTASYPDFTKGDYSLTDIEAFCKKYNLTLQTEYKQTDQYEAGAIISQSRIAGSEIIGGMSLKITIAEAPDTDTGLTE